MWLGSGVRNGICKGWRAGTGVGRVGYMVTWLAETLYQICTCVV